MEKEEDPIEKSIKKSIKKWDQIRNTELGLSFLTSGFGFEINRNEYERWKNIINLEILEKLLQNKNIAVNIDEDGDINIDGNGDGDIYKDYFIHLYIGVLEFETVFYLVDSVSDQKKIIS